MDHLGGDADPDRRQRREDQPDEADRKQDRLGLAAAATTPAAAEELPMQLDTVWFFPHLERGVCIYRGRTTVADSDALDLAAVMIGYERQGDAPRTIEHYREVLTLRLDRETAAAHAFNEAQLTPLPTAGQREAHAAEQAQAEAQRDQLREQNARDVAQAMAEKFGGDSLAEMRANFGGYAERVNRRGDDLR